MIIGSAGTSIALVVVGVAIFALIVVFLKSCLKVVQQGCVGVVKRFGEFRSILQPGLHVLMPLADRMDKVDIREFPRTGDQQAVITKDNVSLQVSATIFCQVTDVKLALFEVNDFGLAIDQMARTALRAVFGELTLDESLSERETINTKMQDHMAEATLKWGVRLNRIEILDITPPTNVLQAMSEQKEAEQHKRAAILKSEGDQQAADQQRPGPQAGRRPRGRGPEAGLDPRRRGPEADPRAPRRWREAGRPIARRRRGGRPQRHRRVADQAQHAGGDAAASHPGPGLVVQFQAGRPLRGGRAGRRGPGAGRRPARRGGRRGRRGGRGQRAGAPGHHLRS